MKAIDEWYKKWWNNRNPEEEPKPVPWEPDIDKSLPKDVYDAMVRTAHIDKEREIEAINEQYYNAMAEQQNNMIGASNAGMAAMAGMRDNRLDVARWSSQMFAQYRNMALGPQIAVTSAGEPTTPTWRNTEMNNGQLINHGVVRINFPFGQVEMDIRNEAELDRMVEMAKHMLRIHEENQATAAVRDNLAKSKQPQVIIEPGVAPPPTSFFSSMSV